MTDDDVVIRLIKRAAIRRNDMSRRSVQEGRADRLSDLLEEAAIAIILLRALPTVVQILSKAQGGVGGFATGGVLKPGSWGLMGEQPSE